MKVALLISGEYRTFGICRKNMPFIDDPRVDVFVSTWNKSVYINPICSLNDTHYISEDEIRATLKKNATIEIEDPSILSVQKYNTQLIHRWKRGIELIKSSGVNYDYIIITRPDIMFSNYQPITLETIERYSDALGVAWSDSLNLNRLSDIVMVGKGSNVINIFDNLTVEKWVNDTLNPDWHKWWYKFVSELSPIVNTPEFNHFIFCRYWTKDHHTYKEVVDIQHDWRDLTLLTQLRCLPRQAMVDTWNEEIVANAEKKWLAGHYKKYLPKKSVLFLYGRLNHLDKIWQHTNFLQAMPKDTTDVVIHGDYSYSEIIPGFITKTGYNDENNLKNLCSAFISKPNITLTNSSHIDHTLTLYERLKFLVRYLEDSFYGKDTVITICRADLYCNFDNTNEVAHIMKFGTDRFHVRKTASDFADDQLWITSLGLLREYLEYCMSSNYVERYRFLSHISLARFLEDTSTFMELECQKVICRNNCTNYSNISVVEDATAKYWKVKHNQEYYLMYQCPSIQ